MAGNVSAGQITLYRGTEFTGSSLSTNDAVANMERSQFREMAASVVIAEGTWEACSEPYFRGRCAQLRPGTYSQLSRQLDGPVASVREVAFDPAPVRVTVNPDIAPPPVVAAAPAVTPAAVAPALTPAAGPQIVLYRHGAQGVVAVDLTSNVDDLHSRRFENQADAAFVTSGVWRLCDDQRGRGQCADFSPGRYESLGALNGRVESAYLIASMPNEVATAAQTVGRAVLYQYPNYAGPVAVIDYNRAPDLDWANFKNPATSARIESGTWLMCSQMAYQGDCQVLGPGEYPLLSGTLGKGVYSARQVSRPEYGFADVDRFRFNWLQ
jgi:hypothetical protein